jgi:hypothetical protein
VWCGTTFKLVNTVFFISMENTVLTKLNIVLTKVNRVLTKEDSREKVKQNTDEGKENAYQLPKRESKCGAEVE